MPFSQGRGPRENACWGASPNPAPWDKVSHRSVCGTAPSRPYFNTEEYSYKDSKKSISNKDDWSKVKGIFALWDYFFTLILSQKKHFQVIMLEHVSESAWSGCHFVNLVDIFDGEENALIPIEKEAPPTSSNN